MSEVSKRKFLSPRHKQRCKHTKGSGNYHYANRSRQVFNRILKLRKKLRVA